MKNALFSLTLTISLALSAWAEEKWAQYRDPAGLFRLDVPGKVRVEKETEGTVLEASDSTGKNVVGLFILDKGYTRYQMFKLLADKTGGDTLSFSRKEFNVSGHPALEISGITRDGVPIGAILVGGKNRSYVMIARSFDLAFQRHALQSFRLK